MVIKSDNWAEKYRPKTLSDVVGHPTAIGELRMWALSWEDNEPDSKAVILYGGPGTGKTSSAYALANDMGWEVIELNASDQRTASKIDDIAGSGSRMETLTGVKRLIILDEADNIFGSEDRGGEKAVLGLIRKTKQPMILIANDLYEMSYALRKSGKLIQFRSITNASIISTLKTISTAEGISCEAGVIQKIAENADGDLRSAINDLQAISIGKTKVELKDIIIGERDVKEDIFKVLEKIFRGTNIYDAYNSTFGLDEDPDGFIQWIDENLPNQYINPRDLSEAYSYLSRSSLFLGRVRIRRDYSLWRYASVLMTAGILVARAKRQTGYTKFQYPAIRKRLKETKNMRKVRDSLAKKIGSHCHTSMNFAKMYLFPFFKLMMKDEKHAQSIVALLELEPEEIALISAQADTQKVYSGAQSLIKEDTAYEIEMSGGFGRGKDIQSVNKEDKERDKSQSSLLDF